MRGGDGWLGDAQTRALMFGTLWRAAEEERRVTSDEEGRKKCRVPSAEGKRSDGRRGARGERRGVGDQVGRLTGSDE